MFEDILRFATRSCVFFSSTLDRASTPPGGPVDPRPQDVHLLTAVWRADIDLNSKAWTKEDDERLLPFLWEDFSVPPR